MTRKEAIKVLNKDLQIIDDPKVTMTAREWEEHDDHMRDALETAIEALEQQNCNNCKYSEETDGMNCYECVKGISDNFEALEQEPKRGKWLDDNNSFNSFYANCSECGYQMDKHAERGYHNYCPYCGARMESDEQ